MKKVIIITLILVASIGILSFFVQTMNTNPQTGQTAVKLPTAIKAESPETNTSVNSADGKVTLNLKTQTTQQGKIYTVLNNGQTVYANTLVNGQITLPFNAWSINDKSFFIKVEEGGIVNFIAFPGEISVSDKFKEKYPDYVLQDVTGWADSNLLIVNVNNGSKDMSFWFDTKSQTFIQLSNRFN